MNLGAQGKEPRQLLEWGRWNNTQFADLLAASIGTSLVKMTVCRLPVTWGTEVRTQAVV
jgi:hypothetical protein